MPDMCTDRFSTYFDYVIRTFNNTCKVPGISSTDTMTMLNLPLGDPKISMDCDRVSRILHTTMIQAMRMPGLNALEKNMPILQIPIQLPLRVDALYQPVVQ